MKLEHRLMNIQLAVMKYNTGILFVKAASNGLVSRVLWRASEEASRSAEREASRSRSRASASFGFARLEHRRNADPDEVGAVVGGWVVRIELK